LPVPKLLSVDCHFPIYVVFVNGTAKRTIVRAGDEELTSIIDGDEHAIDNDQRVVNKLKLDNELRSRSGNGGRNVGKCAKLELALRQLGCSSSFTAHFQAPSGLWGCVGYACVLCCPVTASKDDISFSACEDSRLMAGFS
jgi:hypothetical protein